MYYHVQINRAYATIAHTTLFHNVDIALTLVSNQTNIYTIKHAFQKKYKYYSAITSYPETRTELRGAESK